MRCAPTRRACTVPMSGVQLNGQAQTSTGTLNQLTVVDARGLPLPWTLTAQLADDLVNSTPPSGTDCYDPEQPDRGRPDDAAGSELQRRLRWSLQRHHPGYPRHPRRHRDGLPGRRRRLRWHLQRRCRALAQREPRHLRRHLHRHHQLPARLTEPDRS